VRETANERKIEMNQDLMQQQTRVTPHSVPLVATLVGKTIKVSGNGAANLPANSGSHRFNFTLTSPPGVAVQFQSLDSEDNCSTCPPASGENSTQIVAVNIGSDTAAFTDNNNNQGGPMDVSYQWNFSCDDRALTVEPFDPIITNGGTTRT
jgi:hypothetical protein